jgi:hypothetical protein
MFSLFKKSPPSIPYSDKVWKKAEYARRGMLMMAMLRLQHNKPCLLISFFESETDQLQEFMREHKLDFVKLDDSSASGLISTTLYLINANDLTKSTVAGFLKQNASTFSGEALFSGHYPMSATEYSVLKGLSDSGYDRFVFCLSFEDALLKMFGSENILPLLEKLGLEEEESIEHAMVTQSIKRAREKVEGKVSHEIKAKSPEDWFALNLKK